MSGGDGVDQGLEGGSVSVQARHHRVRVTAGVAQERMARKALGQQACWGWWGPRLFPLPGPRRGRGLALWRPGGRVGWTTGPSRRNLFLPEVWGRGYAT